MCEAGAGREAVAGQGEGGEEAVTRSANNLAPPFHMIYPLHLPMRKAQEEEVKGKCWRNNGWKMFVQGLAWLGSGPEYLESRKNAIALYLRLGRRENHTSPASDMSYPAISNLVIHNVGLHKGVTAMFVKTLLNEERVGFSAQRELAACLQLAFGRLAKRRDVLNCIEAQEFFGMTEHDASLTRRGSSGSLPSSRPDVSCMFSL